MGTRGQMFWLKPDCRTAWSLASGRARHLSPSFALRDGKAVDGVRHAGRRAAGSVVADFSCAWSTTTWASRKRSTRRRSIPSTGRRVSGRVSPGRARWFWKGRFPNAVMYELKARDHKAEKGDDWSEGRISGARDRGRSDARRCQSARDAGLRGRAVMAGSGPAMTEWSRLSPRIQNAALIQPGRSSRADRDCEGPSQRLEFLLQPGMTLNDALTRPLVDAGMKCAALVFQGGALGPFSYVMPGPPTRRTRMPRISASLARRQTRRWWRSPMQRLAGVMVRRSCIAMVPGSKKVCTAVAATCCRTRR